MDSLRYFGRYIMSGIVELIWNLVTDWRCQPIRPFRHRHSLNPLLFSVKPTTAMVILTSSKHSSYVLFPLSLEIESGSICNPLNEKTNVKKVRLKCDRFLLALLHNKTPSDYPFLRDLRERSPLTIHVHGWDFIGSIFFNHTFIGLGALEIMKIQKGQWRI